MEELQSYKILISDRAQRLITLHVEFLAESSPNTAREMKERLLKGIRSLSTMPERYPFFHEEFIPPNKYHKMFVKKWYLILYQIKDQTVYVDYVIDCRLDYQWLLK